MHTTKWCAGACRLVLVGVTSVGAHEQMVPVMRMGNWIQVGGGLPVAWGLQAQERLQAAGFAPGPLDGTLGPQTRDALRRYQKTHQLPATGEREAATLQATSDGNAYHQMECHENVPVVYENGEHCNKIVALRFPPPRGSQEGT